MACIIVAIIGNLLYEHVPIWRATYDGLVNDAIGRGERIERAEFTAGAIMFGGVLAAISVLAFIFSRSYRDDLLQGATGCGAVVAVIGGVGFAVFLFVQFVKWSWNAM